MDIREFQKLMRKLYYTKDSRRGVFKTYLWLIEEVGELSEAIRKGVKDDIASEMADIIAWLSSLANLLDIDLNEAVLKKYGKGVCPRCFSIPCKCEEHVK